MGLEVRRTPDGGTAFVCSRGPTESSDERLGRWIGAEALKQGRCSLCLALLVDGCGGPGACTAEPLSTARAVGILRGMVAG